MGTYIKKTVNNNSMIRVIREHKINFDVYNNILKYIQ
jgi:hypothetical protein